MNAVKRRYSYVGTHEIWTFPRGTVRYVKLRNGSSIGEYGKLCHLGFDKEVIIVGKMKYLKFME